MYNKIVLAGGAGYIGQVLTRYYRDRCRELVILSRQPHPNEGHVRYEQWDGRQTGRWTAALEGADLVVNLAGKNVNCRYTKKNRAEILRSRLDPTNLLGRVIGQLSNPPKVWITCASATIYRHAEDYPQDESAGETGSGFSVDVCRAWEAAVINVPTPRTKKIILRTGMVLGADDGVWPRLRRLVRLGLGGRQGSGRQYISWIHEEDLARITEWMIENGTHGAFYNATAPESLRNKDFMRLLRAAYHRSFGLSTPAWLLELGALVIGTETELVLKSRWVYPGRLLREGFRFRYPDAASAIEAIAKEG